MKGLVFAVAALLLAALLAQGCHCNRTTAGGDSEARSQRELPQPTASAERPATVIEQLELSMAKLTPLHQKLSKPKPGEWLAEHDEPGQTFAEYRGGDPVMPVGARKVLYIQPLGALTKTQRKIVLQTVEYMKRFFGLRVRTSKALPLSLIPDRARRVHPSWGTKQILTSYVLDDLLAPRLPKDAAAYISLTSSDLWPGRGWNFVFGQASLRDRVGVWSIYRYGDPDENDTAYRKALLRAIKVAVHETGHMFSLRHCTAYRCVMGGSNSLEESDQQPLWACSECAAKVAYAMKTDLLARYRQLAAFASEQQFAEQAAFFRRSIQALE